MLFGSIGCGCLRNSSKQFWKFERLLSKKHILITKNVVPLAYIQYNTIQNLQYRTFHPWTSKKQIARQNIISSCLQTPLVNLVFKRNIAEKKQNDSKILTVPNVLTGFRLLAAPYIGYLVFCENFDWALGLFFLAAVTDVVDGWIARNFKGQSSILGSYIDPLADKILISLLTFSLTYVGIIPVPLCVMIILRDVMIMTSAAHFHYKHLEPPKTMERFFDFENSKVQMEPTLISKYNTFLQLGLVAFSLSAPVCGLVDHPLLHAYWYLVASTTVLSGLSYVVKDKSSYFVK